MSNRFVWFRKWISGKQRIEDIARESGYSSRQLRRWFDEYLCNAPKWKIQHRETYRVLVDGTWLDDRCCLVVYRDAVSKSTIYYRFAEDENEHEIIKDLQAFKTMRLRISSFTTDGGNDIIRAYIHLHRAIPDMFKYIDAPDVPNNTNSLESFFGHLKDNLRIHRGLSREHQKDFIKWYLYFADEKKKK